MHVRLCVCVHVHACMCVCVCVSACMCMRPVDAALAVEIPLKKNQPENEIQSNFITDVFHTFFTNRGGSGFLI